jgi:hypothetical protein
MDGHGLSFLLGWIGKGANLSPFLGQYKEFSDKAQSLSEGPGADFLDEYKSPPRTGRIDK